MQIFVDGDACPVKAEVEKVAARHGLAVTIVSNGGLRPSANWLLRHVTVAEGADAARLTAGMRMHVQFGGEVARRGASMPTFAPSDN